MVPHGIEFPRDSIEAFCRRHAIQRLAVFGSILRADFSPQSDIDVLVEFHPASGPSLLGFAGMQLELAEILGREVHLHTPPTLPPRWRTHLQSTALVQYAA